MQSTSKERNVGKPVEEIAEGIYRDLLNTTPGTVPQVLAQRAFEQAEAFVAVANSRTPVAIAQTVDTTPVGGAVDGADSSPGSSKKRRLEKVTT
jgi:microcystin degradation protein MlrC